MRAAEELRVRWLSLIPLVIMRPSMYAATGRETRLLADRLLTDLCFLDDRDGDAAREQSRLSQTYGARGVAGPFEVLFGSRRCQAEVAAAYAEVFRRLGYLPVDSPVSGDQWQEMATGLRERFEGRDVTQDEAVSILGKPSLVVDRRVLCYAPADPASGWLFVDCHAAHGSGPLVRSVRLSGQDVVGSGPILTRYGATLRRRAQADAPATPAVRLELSKNTVVPGEIITYTVVNDGDDRLMFGLRNRFEHYSDDGWQPVVLPRTRDGRKIVIPAVGFNVFAGEHRPRKMLVPRELRPGSYRLTKDLSVADSRGVSRETISIRSEFTVEASGNAEQ